MTNAVFLHPKAAKEPKKLEAHIRARIIKRAGELRQNPITVGKSLNQSDFCSLR